MNRNWLEEREILAKLQILSKFTFFHSNSCSTPILRLEPPPLEGHKHLSDHFLWSNMFLKRLLFQLRDNPTEYRQSHLNFYSSLIRYSYYLGVTCTSNVMTDVKIIVFVSFVILMFAINCRVKVIICAHKVKV